MRALIREVPASFAKALSAEPPSSPIDVALARSQHVAYRAALEACGAHVIAIPAADAHPDCCFVEDTAVIAGDLAVIARPGAPSRRGETVAVAGALTAAGFDLAELFEPATLDGGDCMRVGDTIYVGRSARSNATGIAELADRVAGRGFRVIGVDLPPHVLHLKCVCSPLAADTILLADGSIEPSTFAAARIVRVPVAETYAANAVAIGQHAIIAAGFPRTLDAVVATGLTAHPVPTSEVRKADGSLTCQSIVFA